MSTFSPPLYISDVFNSSLFNIEESTPLTLFDADRRYLKLSGGVVTGNITLNASLTFSGTVSGPIINSNTYLLSGSSILMSALTSVTAGAGSASKALILDSSLNINNINNLTFTGIINGPTYQLSGSTILMSALTSVTLGAGSASKALVLDASRNINNINILTTTEFVLSSNIRLVTSGGVNYIQSGTALTGSSSADLVLTNTLNTFSASARVLMMKASGKVGIQNYNPTKQLDINSTTGDCLRLQYNSPTDGTGSNNVDFNVSATGQLTITPSGGLTTLNAPNGNDMLLLTSTNPTTRNTIRFQTDVSSMEFGSRSGSAGAYPNTLYMYTNGSYKWVMNAASGDSQILSTTDSTSQSTGGLILKGGLGVEKNIYTTGSLTVDRAGGSNFNLKNGANTAFLEVSSTNMLRLVAGGGSMALNIGATGVSINNGTSAARSIIDMGATATSKGLALFNNTSSYYGVSANFSSLNFSSFSACNWYSSCSDSNPTNFNSMSLTSGGTLTTAENVIAGTGIWCKQGFNSTGRSGNGVALVMGNSTYGECYAYDYGTGQYKALYVGNVMYVNDASDSVNINGGLNAGLYPLTVNGSSSTTFAPYGFLSSGGAGSGGSSGVVPVSIWAANRIACSEFNAYSDLRLKENIKNINTNDCLEFVKKINPKIYNWKVDKKNISIGYIAQDILRLRNDKWDNLVSLSEDSELEEIIDDDGFINPKGKRFQVNYSGAIPILHQALKHSLDIIDKLDGQIDFLETRLNETVKSANAAHNEIISLNERLNEVIDYINEEKNEKKPRKKAT